VPELQGVEDSINKNGAVKNQTKHLNNVTVRKQHTAVYCQEIQWMINRGDTSTSKSRELDWGYNRMVEYLSAKCTKAWVQSAILKGRKERKEGRDRRRKGKRKKGMKKEKKEGKQGVHEAIICHGRRG
jgi:hypothetical protein